MQEWQATGVLIFLFALRCIAPLVITIGLAYFMNRLVDRWEAEEALIGRTELGKELQPEVSTSSQKPAINLPCWVVRKCNPEKRSNCAAYHERQLPCWVARTRSEGALPANCPGCPVYDNSLVLT